MHYNSTHSFLLKMFLHRNDCADYHRLNVFYTIKNIEKKQYQIIFYIKTVIIFGKIVIKNCKI